GRLEQAHRAGEYAEHAVGAAGGRELGWRRLPEQAAVAGALVGLEHRQLPVEAEDRGGHDGDLQTHAGVVEQVAGGEVVEAVDDDVVAANDLEDVRSVDPHRVLDDVDVGVERVDRLLGGVDLGNADPRGGVDHLPLQI